MWCLAVYMLLCSLFVADRIVGMEELELHYRRRGRYNLQKIKIATISVRMVCLALVVQGFGTRQSFILGGWCLASADHNKVAMASFARIQSEGGSNVVRVSAQCSFEANLNPHLFFLAFLGIPCFLPFQGIPCFFLRCPFFPRFGKD